MCDPAQCCATQPGHPFVGRRNEYQPKGGDPLRLGSKGRWFVCGWQVKLCDSLVTRGPSERFRDKELKALYKFAFFTLLHFLFMQACIQHGRACHVHPYYTVRHKKLHHFVFAITLSYLSLFEYLLVHIYRDKFGTN